ncbi:MAG TPA: sulfurtransferase [Steroidobacteraceae bacterium]|nr:sulfurtransferase [Steroidobacteraceae bacterium]
MHEHSAAAARSRFDTLIDAATLAGMAAAAGLAIVDCRHDLKAPAWGRQAFREGHIPGAAFASLDEDLSGPRSAQSGRHPLPARAALTAWLGRMGIGNGTQVIAYDQGGQVFAARLWWLLRWLGHERVAVLDGGLAAWQAAGGSLDTGSAPPLRAVFAPGPPLEFALDTAEVQQLLRGGATVLVDARTADRFAGQNETLDPVAGHIPGARNHPFTQDLAADGRLLPPAQLAAAWRHTLAGAPVGDVVTMCGSGVTACHSLLALSRAGLAGGRLYAGSWSEWIRDPARPVATGS